jgi:NAD(P)H-dependent flavin oxidoreductase YrpB (nitropropane dioxygenase family)
LGILPIWDAPVEVAIAKIKKTQSLTKKPFAVNLRADTVQTQHILAARDAGISIMHFFWGNPTASMQLIKDDSIQMIATVEDRVSAIAAIDAGASALIVQGIEAGGHSRSTTPIKSLLISILDVAGETPIIAAGGCANGYDAKPLFNMGAMGILFGTRFVLSTESEAHQDYKQAMIDAGINDTVRSLCFDDLWPGAPHRTLKNSTYRTWEKAGRPVKGSRPGEGDIIMRTPDGQALPRYIVVPPQKGMTGDILAAAMYAGTGVGKIHDCPSCKQIIAKITTEFLS